MFFKKLGGAEQVKIADRVAFHDSPKCQNPANLPEWLGLWEQLRREHGQHLPEEHLKPMLLNILPKETAADVRKNLPGTRGQPVTTGDILEFPRSDYHRLTDESVAAQYRARLFSGLPGAKPNRVHSLVQDEKPGGVVPEELVHKLSEVVAAFNQRGRDPQGRGTARSSSPGNRSQSQLPTPDAKWDDCCWHCDA